MLLTDVKAIDGREIKGGDNIRVILPERSAYKSMILAEGKVFFSHGSFRVPNRVHTATSSRLDDFSHDCIFEII